MVCRSLLRLPHVSLSELYFTGQHWSSTLLSTTYLAQIRWSNQSFQETQLQHSFRLALVVLVCTPIWELRRAHLLRFYLDFFHSLMCYLWVWGFIFVSAIAFALAHSAFKQMLPSTNVSSIGSKHCICLIISTVQYSPTHQHQRSLQKQMFGWEHGQPLFLQNRLGPLHPLCPPIEHLNGTHHHVVGLLVMFVFCHWRAARTSPNHHIPIIT